MNYKMLIEEAGAYVRKYMQDHEDLNLFYHNLHHTKTVVTATARIARHYQLKDREFFITMIAAWFHDTGYFTDVLNHEEIGALIVGKFLRKRGVEEAIVLPIQNCIKATKIPQRPKTLLEEIVCDADMFNLGTENFIKQNSLLKSEMEQLHCVCLDHEEWHHKTINFMESHHYHTAYCIHLLNQRKIRNMEMLMNQVAM